uniref:Lipoxygenase n=1 Tax=Actineria villosa TaxID=227975 RepID=F2Z929_ACTVL|nr:lipoxygenase [Actineria villosa]
MQFLKYLILLVYVQGTPAGKLSKREKQSCPIDLPQNVKPESQCYRERRLSLISNRYAYRLRKGTTELPFNRLEVTVEDYKKFLLRSPFLLHHARLWRKQLNFIESRQAVYVSDKVFLPEAMNGSEFDTMRKFFKDGIKSEENLIKEYMVIPSDEEPFLNGDWKSDKYFAEQRLAGTNPMTLQKITIDSEYGMPFQELKKLINPKFEWTVALNRALPEVIDSPGVIEAIKKGRLYVLYHPFAKYLNTLPDLTDDDPRRQMWKQPAPVAIFASKLSGTTRELVPVAIQMDANLDSPIYSPQDGDNWMLAKLNMQLTDLGNSQMVEHLTKVHFVTESLCLSHERQISERHPLFEMLKYHCRGIFTTNTLAAPELLDERKALHEIFGYGHSGGAQLVRDSAQVLHWDNLQPARNIKIRGLDDEENLPYYPYRDDSELVYGAIKAMVKEFINAFYNKNEDVAEDEEIQRFAYEISADGDGMIRGFPSKITRKSSLIETITRMIWIATAQHSVVGYPVADYATYVPNVSTKLYDVYGIPPNVFDSARLNARKTASASTVIFFKIGTFRYDKIFDYADKLQDSKAKEIVSAHKLKLDKDVQQELEKRNKERLDEGHLTYPYLLPKWITNGVQE